MPNGHRLLTGVQDDYPVYKLVYIRLEPEFHMDILPADEIDTLLLEISDDIGALKTIQYVYLPFGG